MAATTRTFSRLAVGGLASVLALAISLLTVSPGAGYPGANGRIIFTENSTSSTALWSIRPDGSDLQLVTRVQSTASRAFVSFPSVSADGSKLAVMLIEHFDRPVRCGAFDAYSCKSVVLMATNGANQKVVLSDARIASLSLALSPDGSQVALPLINSSRRGDGESIYLVNTSNHKLTRLTRGAGAVVDSYPRWSPDGRALSFDSNRDAAITGRSWSVFTVTIRGGKTSRLMPDSNGNDLYADWSPAGDRLAFVRTFSPAVDDAIFSVNRDGTGLQQLLRDSSSLEIPAFSPDGTQIAYTRAGQLWLMDTDGNNRRAVVTGATFGFTWVPQR
jgi:Tol biopolymer transport system component